MPAEPSGAGYGCREAMVVIMGVSDRKEVVSVHHCSYPPPLSSAKLVEGVRIAGQTKRSSLPSVLDKAEVTVPCPHSVRS